MNFGRRSVLITYCDLDRGFDLPQPIPPDLLLPFGEFVQRYALAPMIGIVFGYGQGLGDLLQMPTVYVPLMLA